jgi:hypothetical protein
MKVTDEMVKRYRVARAMAHGGVDNVIREGLEAALADVPEPAVEALSKEEAEALRLAEGLDNEERGGKTIGLVIQALRKRFPKCVAVEQTPGQTLCEAMGSSRWEHADKMHYEAAAAKLLAAHGGAK